MVLIILFLKKTISLFKYIKQFRFGLSVRIRHIKELLWSLRALLISVILIKLFALQKTYKNIQDYNVYS